MSEILTKANAFYDQFTRKGTDDVINTHYCPGCGHGILHKFVAEAIDDFKIQDRTVFISPVGCSVFAYYYFDTGNVQAAHGRAPAVGTGLKRSLPNSIVISYQGDGDLAAIGTAEIIHAANRGENMTVFFVNNAIYGMTGGQMAPTTLMGQKTATTPYGRRADNEGYPVKMSEMLATMEAPVYIERVSVATPKDRMKARLAARKAIQNQIDGKGFSFVEVMSPCPSGLKMNPLDGMKWVEENMHKVFPMGVYKDKSNEIEAYEYKEVKPYDMANHTAEELFNELEVTYIPDDYHKGIDKNTFKTHNLRIAGFGGQGILSAGVTMAILGMYEGLETSWIPSYGPEMRGGTSNCHVKLSATRIGSPLVDEPNVFIAMNEPSLDKFEDILKPNALVIINSSLVNRKLKRTDLDAVYLPLTDIATKHEVPAAQTLAGVIAYIVKTNLVPIDNVKFVLSKNLKKKSALEKNIAIIDEIVNILK